MQKYICDRYILTKIDRRSLFSRDISQIVEKVLKKLQKNSWIRPVPETDDFQNLINSSLSTQFLVNCYKDQLGSFDV